MKTEELLLLDCRKPESMPVLQKALRKIGGPLSKLQDNTEAPLIFVEQAIDRMCRKYDITVQYIIPCRQPNEITTYSASVRKDDSNEWAGSVYGKDVYELFVKLAIKLYSEIKTKEIPLRDKGDAK